MKSKLFVAAGGLLCLVGSSCGHDDSSNQVQNTSPAGVTEYSTASCQYGYSDGGKVDLSVANLGLIDTRVFGKKLNISLHQAVLGASAENTYNFFINQGVQIYQMDDPLNLGKCHMFDSLPQAPSDFQSYFVNAGNTGTPSGGTVVGLYSWKDNKAVPSSSSTSEIGILADSNRWTMVHEFTHHLFETEATKETYNPDVLESKLTTALSDLQSKDDASSRNQTAENYDAEVASLATTADLMRQLVIRFPLEEVAIESLLQSEYKNGQTDFMPITQKSSNWYIAVSAEKAVNLLADIDQVAEALQSKATDRSALSQLAQIKTQQSDLEDQIQKAMDAAGVKWSDAASDIVLAGAPEVQPCAHMREFDRAAGRAKELFKMMRSR